MTQYMLSVHDPKDGRPAMSDQEMQQVYAQVDAFNEAIQASGSWVFAGGLEGSSTATVVDATATDVLVTDGPYLRPRSSSAVSGSSRPPTWTPPSRSPSAARQPARDLSRSGRSRASDPGIDDGLRPGVGLPRGARPRGGQPGPPVRRPRPRRGRHRRGPGRRRRAMAHRRGAAQPGRLADHGRRQQGAGPDPP